MTVAWVIGSGGLLGTALCRALRRTGTTLFTPPERFLWNSETNLFSQLEMAVKAFSGHVAAQNNWQIYWAAGLGTMHSVEAEFATETRVLSKVHNLVESDPGLSAAEGCFTLASSAGAVYAGATDDVITEDTPVAPTTPYAREKLRQEGLVRAYSQDRTNVTALVARISTLYGPGQAAGKRQGLITLIARRMLRHDTVHIYVPFDTIRDYITADDAAEKIIATVSAISGKSGSHVKIVASEQPTSIAEIVSLFRRIVRHAPRIVVSSSQSSSLYVRRMQFHSIVVPTDMKTPKTSLAVGIAQTIAAELAVFAKSG